MYDRIWKQSPATLWYVALSPTWNINVTWAIVIVSSSYSKAFHCLGNLFLVLFSFSKLLVFQFEAYVLLLLSYAASIFVTDDCPQGNSWCHIGNSANFAIWTCGACGYGDFPLFVLLLAFTTSLFVGCVILLVISCVVLCPGKIVD